MIIELHNFGPIKLFSFDTDKDIHAIFGKNNIGKSYAISAVYLILKNFTTYRSVMDYDDFQQSFRLHTSHNIRFRIRTKSFEDELKEKLKSESSTLSIRDEVGKNVKLFLNQDFIFNITQSFKNSFAFETIQNQMTDKQLQIKIQFDFVNIVVGLSDKKDKLEVTSVEIRKDIVIKKINSVRYHKEERSLITFYHNSKSDLITDIDDCLSICVNKIFVEIQSSIKNVYFLPASRSGLYNALSAFGAIVAELSQNRTFLRSKIEIPSISEPISDYFLNLNSIKNANIQSDYMQTVDLIEKNILKGKVIYNPRSKKYSYQPNDMKISLDLSFTSSMISEITPIVAHLKYVLSSLSKRNKASNLIFIEEPEAHLHPEIQVLLITYFAELAKSNLKIVMTSHSNYIFNKLSNLVIANEVSRDGLNVSLMKMQEEGSVLEEKAMAVDEYGIEDNNFVDVAEQLYEERMSLLEKL
jgi:predicted ATPase